MLRHSLIALMLLASCGAIAQTQIQSQQPSQVPEVKAEQQPEHRLDDQKNAETDNGHADPASVAGSIVSPPAKHKASDEAQNGGEEGTEFWPPFFGYRLKVTDTLVALFTAGLFVATFFLWLATRNLVRGADDTARRELRAYVGLEEVDFDCPNLTNTNYAPMTADSPWRFADFIVLKIRNFGQTPAREVSTWAVLITIQPPIPLPDDFKFEKHDVNRQTGFSNIISNRTLFPTQPFISKVGIPNLTGLIRAHAGTSSAFVYGAIEYRDIFGAAQETKFCFIYEPWRPRAIDSWPTPNIIQPRRAIGALACRSQDRRRRSIIAQGRVRPRAVGSFAARFDCQPGICDMGKSEALVSGGRSWNRAHPMKWLLHSPCISQAEAGAGDYG